MLTAVTLAAARPRSLADPASDVRDRPRASIRRMILAIIGALAIIGTLWLVFSSKDQSIGVRDEIDQLHNPARR